MTTRTKLLAPLLLAALMRLLPACATDEEPAGLGSPSDVFGGQSGGEFIEPRPGFAEFVACPCDLSAGAVAVLATLEAADACGVEARVDELVGGSDRLDVRVGDTLHSNALGCSDLGAVSPGDQVLMLYRAFDPPPPDELASDAGPSPDTSANAAVFFATLDAPIRIPGTTEDLPSALDDALATLLDHDACMQFASDHMELPDEGDAADAQPDPDDAVVRVDGGPEDDGEAEPDCGP